MCVRSDKQLIDEGMITDQEFIADYYKKQDTIKTLREEYARKDEREGFSPNPTTPQQTPAPACG